MKEFVGIIVECDFLDCPGNFKGKCQKNHKVKLENFNFGSWDYEPDLRPVCQFVLNEVSKDDY